MDVSELRKRILRALEDARKDAATRRVVVDESVKAYEEYLSAVVVPMLRQAATVINATGTTFIVHTPADTARLSAEHAPQTFIEIALDSNGDEPEVVGRISLARGRQGTVVEERPLSPGKPVARLTEEDFSNYLIAAVPKLIVRP